MPVLPAELIDRVIDFLHDDKRRLAACALVCRCWIPSARYHLFETASIGVGNLNTTKFLKILQSSPSTVAPYVRDLTIHITDFVLRSSWLDEVIPHIAPLVAVKALRLRNVVWMYLKPETTATIISTFKDILELQFRFSHFKSLDQFLDLMNSFRSLKKLDVECVVVNNDTFADEWCAPLGLDTLSLDIGYGLSNILSAFISSQPVPRIHSLELYGINVSVLPLVQNFLVTIAPSLHHLYLKFHFPRSTQNPHLDIRRYIDLSCLPELRSVSLMMKFRGRFGQGTVQTKTSFLLSQIVSHHMEVITIYAMLYTIDDFNFLDWNELLDILARPQFSRLRRVYISIQICSSSLPTSTCENLFRSRLHPLESRGILSFSPET